uniref:Transposase n=1 Tax=Ditylenchus dipsaci TaxID=166011 RepID=A0A915E9H1_9BILA
MFLHPSMRNLFKAMNSNIELPTSKNTLKDMLMDKCTAVKKRMKKALENIPVRPSITCDVWSDSSMKHAYLVDPNCDWAEYEQVTWQAELQENNLITAEPMSELDLLLSEIEMNS